ncbi:unnamed protein product [Prorocentrum cordatum]|uniref:Uncharacterized protein n=1 Tax=Prorocentrum cordatum TaxID=2364126 RepID=A0ABN9WWF2_9DINO|nr:unnamed protein product [Polarella glacialis]
MEHGLAGVRRPRSRKGGGETQERKEGHQPPSRCSAHRAAPPSDTERSMSPQSAASRGKKSFLPNFPALVSVRTSSQAPTATSTGVAEEDGGGERGQRPMASRHEAALLPRRAGGGCPARGLARPSRRARPASGRGRAAARRSSGRSHGGRAQERVEVARERSLSMTPSLSWVRTRRRGALGQARPPRGRPPARRRGRRRARASAAAPRAGPWPPGTRRTTTRGGLCSWSRRSAPSRMPSRATCGPTGWSGLLAPVAVRQHAHRVQQREPALQRHLGCRGAPAPTPAAAAGASGGGAPAPARAKARNRGRSTEDKFSCGRPPRRPRCGGRRGATAPRARRLCGRPAGSCRRCCAAPSAARARRPCRRTAAPAAQAGPGNPHGRSPPGRRRAPRPRQARAGLLRRAPRPR